MIEKQHVILTKAQTDEVVFDGYLSVVLASTIRRNGSNRATFSGFTPVGCEYDVVVEFTGEFESDGGFGPCKPVADGPWYGVVCQSCQRKDALHIHDKRRKHKHEKFCRDCLYGKGGGK